MKHLKKYGSTVVLLIILVILIVPSWRVGFQGWFQGLWMSDIEFTTESATPLAPSTQLWSLTNMSGEEALFSMYNDKPIILSFWATWCPSCRAELAELKSLQEEFKNKIHFIAVSEESIETIKKSNLADKFDFLYTTSYFPDDFKIKVYPTLYIINKEMMLSRYEGAGDIDTDKNRKFINGLIDNR